MEVKDKFGNPVRIVRHNGIEERGHRWGRMHTRRRTGRSRTTNEMEKYGALLAVLSNLENEGKDSVGGCEGLCVRDAEYHFLGD